MRVVLVNGERADESGLVAILRKSGIDCVLMRVSAACLREDQHIVWRMASGYPEGLASESGAVSQPRGLLVELTDPPVGALAAIAALRADGRFDDFPIIASLSIDHIDWISGVREFDDFLFAPWSPIELIGRIYAAERRRADARAGGVAQFGDIVSIDASARQVMVNGATIRLTAREYALFWYLWTQRGAVLSRDHLLEHVWGAMYHGGPRTVDVHIRRLRSKLGSALPIETVRGGGYRLIVPAREPHGAREFVPGALLCPPAEAFLPAAEAARQAVQA
jgi:DNA-binding response OmpR family regulator